MFKLENIQKLYDGVAILKDIDLLGLRNHLSKK